jgi:hypothetical protein
MHGISTPWADNLGIIIFSFRERWVYSLTDKALRLPTANLASAIASAIPPCLAGVVNRL